MTPNEPSAMPSAPLPPREIDPAQESLNQALQKGFYLLLAIMAVLVILYLASGVFIIDAGKTGLISRFGKLRSGPDGSPVFQPGLHWTLPDPFEEKLTITGEVQSVTVDNFCFRRSPNEILAKTPLSELDGGGRALVPGTDGAMLTGDKNLSHGLWDVQFRIAAAERFVNRVGDDVRAAEPLIRHVAASSIMRTVAAKRVEDVLHKRQSQIAREVRDRMQDELDLLDVGIEIVQIAPQTIEPVQVSDAFDNVSQAEQDRQALIEKANGEARETRTAVAGGRYAQLLPLIEEYARIQEDPDAEPDELPAQLARINQELDRAGGKVSQLLQEARAQASATRERIKGEYEEFRYYLAQYRQNPEVTAVRLWSDLLRTLLDTRQNEIFFVPAGDTIEIVINRDEQRRLEANRERSEAQKQQQAGR